MHSENIPPILGSDRLTSASVEVPSAPSVNPVLKVPEPDASPQTVKLGQDSKASKSCRVKIVLLFRNEGSPRSLD